MSIWTHVNGSVRVNNHVDENIFKTFTYYSPYEDKKACNVPRGKEESLQIQVYNYPDKGDTRSTINFFGDLRGFDDHQAIIDWILDLIKKLELPVRDGIVRINERAYAYFEDIADDYKVCNRRFAYIFSFM